MIDWIMTIVFLAGSACFTMAISFGGSVYAWNSGTEIALWTVTGVLLVVTILLSIYNPGVSKENRLYPAHFFKRPILVNLQLQIFLSSGIVLVSIDQCGVLNNTSVSLTNSADDDLLHPALLPVPPRTSLLPLLSPSP